MPPEKMRLDKWLWCARFFKTRSLATQAVDMGKVELNDGRVKPAKEIHKNDRLLIHNGEYTWDITVSALSMLRGSAEVARTLYGESQDSQAQREQQRAERRSDPAAHSGRPTKKDRRMIRRFISA